MKRSAAVALLCTVTASASAAVISLVPTADTFVSSANPNSNYGGAGALAVSGAGLPKGEFDSLLQFDLAAAKTSFDSTFGAGNWAIDSITLQLTATPPTNALFNGTGAGPGGTNVNFAGLFGIKWMANDSWMEGNGTPAVPGTTGLAFSTLGSFLGAGDETLGSFSFAGGTSGNNTWTLGLTPSFLADARAGSTLSLLMLPGDQGVSYLSDSRSFGTASLRPALAISASAVPEPHATSILAAAALCWLTARRRHARAM